MLEFLNHKLYRKEVRINMNIWHNIKQITSLSCNKKKLNYWEKN